LKNALPIFGQVLENYAVINITCFSSTIVPCGAEQYNSNLTALVSTRQEYFEYIDKSLSTSSQKQRALFQSLVEIYQAMNNTRNTYKQHGWQYYSFALIVISQPDNTFYNDVANEFIWTFPQPVATDGIVIHSVLYFGSDTSPSGLALSKISGLTDGQSLTATQNLEDVLRDLTYFF